MIRIHALSSWNAFKAGLPLAARDRRTRPASPVRRSNSQSRLFREASLSDATWDPSGTSDDQGLRTHVGGADVPRSGPGQSGGDEAFTFGDVMPGRERTPSPVRVAALSAAATAATVVALSWHPDGGAWVGAAGLAFAALTVAFLSGRVILAPSDARAEASEAASLSTPADGARTTDPSSWRRLKPRLAGSLAPFGRRSSTRVAGSAASPRAAAGTDVRDMRAVDRGTERVRRHVRIRPRRTQVAVVTEQGTRHDAEIIDVSQSGVALEGTMPGVWIGSIVTVGSRRAKAVRMLPNGMALEFSVPIPARALHANIVL